MGFFATLLAVTPIKVLIGGIKEKNVLEGCLFATVEESNRTWRIFLDWTFLYSFFIYLFAHTVSYSLLSVGWFISFPPLFPVSVKLAVRSSAAKLQSSAALTLAHRANCTHQVRNLWWLSNIWKKIDRENKTLILSSFLLSWVFMRVLFSAGPHSAPAAKKQNLFEINIWTHSLRI